MKIRLLTTLLLAGAAISFTGCGSSDSSTGDDSGSTVSETDPVDFEHGSRMLSIAQLDSITNYPDDMTAGEAAGALVYLHHSVEKSSGTKRLVAMRKFNDFFNIVLDNHGDDLRASVAKIRQRYNIDLQKIYEDYATTLAMGDEEGSGADDQSQKVDTIKTFSDSTSTISVVSAAGATITTVE